MLIIPIAAQERRIPTATYDIAYGEEIDESESVETRKSPYTPVTSLTLLNDSLLSSNDNWFVVQDHFNSRSEFRRTIAVPQLNVSEMTVRLFGLVVTGPLEILMDYGGGRVDMIYQSGELCDIIRDEPPNVYENDGLISIYITIESVDWSVIDYLYFSIQVEFTLSQCPVTIDLKRTNGESMFLLQEFCAILNRPVLQFGEHEIHLSKVNDTIYLPNGNYSLSIDWEAYEHSFTDISITNESLSINIRIKTVRLNIESSQKIPGLVVYVGGIPYYDYLPFLLKDSPSFYIPSGYVQLIEVRGNPSSRYDPLHFWIDLEVGDNRNITLLVHENWIFVGGIAFTPGRLAILIASMLVIGLTLFVSRKKLSSSSISLPFILIFLGSILPAYQTTTKVWTTMTLPLYSICTETHSISLGIDISVSSYCGSALAIAESDYFALQYIHLILFILLMITFLGVLYEHLREEIPDFLIAAPIFIYMLIQWFYVVGRINYSTTYPGIFIVTVGVGPFLASFALIIWFIQYRRKRGIFFVAIPKIQEKRERMEGGATRAPLQGCLTRSVSLRSCHYPPPVTDSFFFSS